MIPVAHVNPCASQRASAQAPLWSGAPPRSEPSPERGQPETVGGLPVCKMPDVLCRACGVAGGLSRGAADRDATPSGRPRQAAGVLVRLRAGQVLYGAGQQGDAVFALHHGLVKETLAAGEGERVVRLVGSARVTGLSALLGEPYRHSAHVIGEGYACRIAAGRLRDGVEADPRGALELMRVWQATLDEMDRVMVRFASGPARARLARYILFLFEVLGSEARLRRHEAAQLIGVTPVSVTRLVGEFKRDGLVRESGLRLAVCDAQRLGALARGG